MKTPVIPLILLLLEIYSCTYSEKAVYDTDGVVVTNRLSDICNEIKAIPLQTTPTCKIKNIRQLQYTSSEIFVLNENEICRFNFSGEYLNKITLDHDALICSFTVDPTHRQIVVLDSMQQVNYFSYHGNKQDIIDLGNSNLWHSLYNVDYYNDGFWMIGESLSMDNHFEKRLYKFDSTFNLLEHHLISTIETGRFNLNNCFQPELVVTNNIMHVYSPFSFKEIILQDTLYICSNYQLQQNLNNKSLCDNPCMYVLPFRMNKRFCIASYQANSDEKENYLFCFDHKDQKAYPFHGFTDDFYHSGLVNDLKAADIFNKQFYFYKFAPEIQRSFPERNEEENPVIFMITLKS